MDETTYCYESTSESTVPFSNGNVLIKSIGEMDSGPRILVDSYPHVTVSFLQVIQGSLDIDYSDGRRLRVGPMQFAAVFPGTLMTIATKAKKNHVAYLALSGTRVVEAILKFGFWESQCDIDDFPTDFFRQIADSFRKSGYRGDDPNTLIAVQRMMRTMAARRRNCGGNIPFFDAVRTINRMDFSNFTTDAAARTIGISRSSLRNLFAEAGFVSPGKYMDRVRVARAKEYLYRTQMSTAEIANALGFANENSFSTFFRRMTHITPSHFRRQPIVLVMVPPDEERN